jgi:hypothetical protein
MVTSLTPTDLLAAATEALHAGGFKRVADGVSDGWPFAARLFEDDYSIVCVGVYETWTELASGWTDAQAHVVDLMSTHLVRGDAKSWEGYLVLVTTGTPSAAARSSVAEIRYDTNRLRKLVATGDELITIADVERALLPVLPLDGGVALQEPVSAVDLLPELLEERGIRREVSARLLEAFDEGEPLLESLQDWSGS